MTEVFSASDCINRALGQLNEPPPLPYLERVEPVGELVKHFALPLSLCQPFNRLGRAGTAAQGWRLGRLKRAAFKIMWAQYGGLAKEPLPGRPHVTCVRFSSVPTDSDSGWSKNPIDRLRVGKNGIGLIVDDKLKNVRTSTWWEPAPPKKGFVLVSVWSGEEE